MTPANFPIYLRLAWMLSHKSFDDFVDTFAWYSLFTRFPPLAALRACWREIPV